MHTFVLETAFLFFHPIKYLNWGVFWDYQTLGGHGHSGALVGMISSSLAAW